jgi:ubiquinone/menaquinone biosynthesis C-methylase UbiE
VTAADSRAQSYDVWQRMAAGWDRERRWMWESSRAAGEWMVNALDPQPGQTILELAAGTGETGFLAAARVGRSGKLISTDFAPRMVESSAAEGERLGLTNVDHRQLDAEDMDLRDDSVDGVLCRWGYMLMSDPETAFQETRRVLRDGGGLTFSVFGAPEENPWATVPGRILAEVTGEPLPDPRAPGILAMADSSRTRSLLDATGFQVRQTAEVPFTWRFADFDGYWTFLTELAGALAPRIAALSGEERDAFQARLTAAVEPYRTERGYEIPALTHNTLAS